MDERKAPTGAFLFALQQFCGGPSVVKAGRDVYTRPVFSSQSCDSMMVRFSMMLSGLLLGMASTAAVAQSGGEIWMCLDGSGNRTFTNVGDIKTCKRLEVQPSMVVPAPKAGASKNTARSNPGPADFPKVDAETQKSRDSTRRQLLEDELKKEEKILADLEKVYNEGEPERRGDEKNYQKYLDRVQQLKDDIARTRNNIAEIKRELDTIRN